MGISWERDISAMFHPHIDSMTIPWRSKYFSWCNPPFSQQDPGESA